MKDDLKIGVVSHQPGGPLIRRLIAEVLHQWFTGLCSRWKL